MNPTTCQECGVDIWTPEDGKKRRERTPDGLSADFWLCWYCEDERQERLMEVAKECGL